MVLGMEKKYDIFISYSRKDFQEVKALYEMLKSEIDGIRIWFDINGIESGDEFEDKIINAIDNSEVVIFALSDNAINSRWTKDEVMYARNTDKRVIPVLLEGAKLKGWFLFKFGRIDCIDSKDQLQISKMIGNFCQWFGLQRRNNTVSGKIKAESANSSQIDKVIDSKVKQTKIVWNSDKREFEEIDENGSGVQKYRITLVDCGVAKLGMVKLIKETMGWDLVSSLNFVDYVPSVFPILFSEEEMLSIQYNIEDLGGTVKVEKV